MGILYRMQEFFKKTLKYLLRPLVTLSKRLILPGFKGIPAYYVIKFFMRGIRKGSINIMAAAVSFQFILASIPALLFFFSLIPYIPIDGLQENILQTLKGLLPENAYVTISTTIKDIVLNHRTDVLSIGFFTSIFFFSNGVMSLMNAFNQSAHEIETRHSFRKRIVSIILVLLLSVLVILGAGTIIGTTVFFEFLASKEILQNDLSVFLIRAGETLLLLIVIALSFSLIYYLAPARRGSIPFISPGSILGALLSLVALQVFAYLIDNFGTQNKLYGSLGTILVIMLWVNLNTIVVLIGFELNASIFDANRARKELLEEGEGG